MARADTTAKVRALRHEKCVTKSVFFDLFCPEICKKVRFSKNGRNCHFSYLGYVCKGDADFFWHLVFFYSSDLAAKLKNMNYFFVRLVADLFLFFVHPKVLVNLFFVKKSVVFWYHVELHVWQKRTKKLFSASKCSIKKQEKIFFLYMQWMSHLQGCCVKDV